MFFSFSLGNSFIGIWFTYHTIQYTCSRWTIQWLRSVHRAGQPSPQSSLGHFHHPKKRPTPLSVTPQHCWEGAGGLSSGCRACLCLLVPLYFGALCFSPCAWCPPHSTRWLALKRKEAEKSLELAVEAGALLLCPLAPQDGFFPWRRPHPHVLSCGFLFGLWFVYTC